MAKRSAQDTAAAKAKQQKIILIVGGVLLLAVVALQGPKLMKGSGGTTAAPPAAAVAADGTVTGAAPLPVAVLVTPTKGSALVAGVALPRAVAVKVETNQLASFTLFDAKDPFVPQVGDETATSTDQTGETATANPTTEPTNPGTSGSTGPTATGSTTSTTTQPVPVTYATIDFNTKPQQVQVKDKFPAAEPLFVLKSLTKKQAKISVAGGSFDGGKPVTLKRGKQLTLVNTATGVRYTLKLVYTGAQPEVIEGFTTANKASTGTPTTTTTP